MLNSGDLHQTLSKVFNLPAFRRGQEEVIQSVLNKKDAMAVMPTGGGKSLCFQLPAVQLQKLTVVVSPLISLMRDQVTSLRKIGVPAGCLYSGQSLGDKKQIFSDIALASTYILYVSPERVQKPGFAHWIRNQPVALFAVDEAHCMSQWGPDFREDYFKLNILRQLRPDVPILTLTATATPHVLDDIRRRLTLKSPDRHVYGFYRPNLYLQVQPCENEAIKYAYLKKAITKTPEGRIIVYCGTRKATEELCEVLSTDFEHVGFYHAGLSTANREDVEQQYGVGHIRILCATNAFGMGVDHPDVRLVVHHQLPANIESYYQEIGRAGRDGDPSTCLLLYSRKDKGLQSYFIMNSKADHHIVRHRWQGLDHMVSFAEGGECRHGDILTYFRDTHPLNHCGHCDICEPKSENRVGEIVSTTTWSKVSAKLRKKESPSIKKPTLSEDDQKLLEQLKSWRRDLAKEQGLPAFCIFSDKTLNDLLEKKPTTVDDLFSVYGLGDKKIEAFGQQLVQQIDSFL